MEIILTTQRRRWAIFVLLAAFFLLTPKVEAAPQKGQVVLVIADGVTLEEIMDPNLPALNAMVRQGASGLLNVNTAGAVIPENTYMTLGAGKKAIASPLSGLAFNAQTYYNGRPAASSYFARMGQKVQPEQIVNLSIARDQKANLETPYAAVPGTLGQGLTKLGLNTIVLGNSEVGNGANCLASLIAMNRQGVIDGGLIDQTLTLPDNHWPFGRKTNYQALYTQYLKWKDTKGLVVIDTGDLYRLNRGQDEVPEATWQKERQTSLYQLNKFIGKLMQHLDASHDEIILVTPTPLTTAKEKGDLVTPVVFWGKGVTPGAVLTSSTTRKIGMITLTDIAPSILAFFRNSPVSDNINGRPVQYILMHDTSSYLISYHQRLISGYQQRPWLLVPLCLLWVLGIGGAVYAKFKPGNSYSQLRKYLTGILLLPVGALLVSAVPTNQFGWKLAIMLGITGGLTGLVHLVLHRPQQRLIAVSLITTLALMIDAVTGGSFSQFSPLGYDLIIGARFYGLGNEFMGILIAASLMAVAIVYQTNWSKKKKRLYSVGIFVFATIALAFPFFGANVGGTITAVVAFSVAAMKINQQKIGWKQVLYVVMGVCLVLGFVTMLDLAKLHGQPSHLGKAIIAFSNGNLEEVQRIIDRKVVMNLTILRMTGWTLLAWIIAFCVVVYRPMAWLKRIFDAHPALQACLIGGAIGSCTALLFNDSGAIAAACMLAFFTPAILYLDFHLGGK